MKRRAILYGKNVTVYDNGRLYHKSFSTKDEARSFKESVVNGTDPIEELVKKESPLFEGSEYFVTRGGQEAYLEGTVTPLPQLLVDTILDNQEEEESFRRFWTLCLLNPDRSVVKRIFDFIHHYGLSITENGYFVTFKSVRSRGDRSFTDTHTSTMDINLGVAVSIPRDKCDPDPTISCSSGLHVGSPKYVADWHGDATLMCLVNPMHVVSVPYDYDAQKMRTCEYYPAAVVGNHYKDMMEVVQSNTYENNYLAYELAKLASMTDDQLKVHFNLPLFDSSDQPNIETYRKIINERRKYLV